MANYVKSTNFAGKDTLPTGDPLKVVKGTEIDVEFNAIATAVISKADLASPTFTGTPFAPTASPGTNTTQLATTAFVTSALTALYPVGSVYINATNSTNPGTLLGFGTWTAFGAGRVPVGFNASDPLFDTAEETGGSKDAIVVSHSHTTGSAGSASGSFRIEVRDNGVAAATNGSGIVTLGSGGSVGGSSLQGSGNDRGTTSVTTTVPDHTHTVSTAGSSGTNANLQPYITVYMWKRTS
jgi:hypothetical protein